jgi:hypothetical protein
VGSSFGKYQLIRKLASGGMGEVFLARPEGAGAADKPLVLKRILPHLARNKEFLDLFLDEARIAARLNHPNVVRILELGDVEGAWYLLMEYVPGKDLRGVAEKLRSKRRLLPLGLACRVAADAAAGLGYAHRTTDAQGRPMGIVHRDVSPHNLLVSFDGAVKLIDFGVSKAAGQLEDGEAGMLRGKYPYMSPEQAAGGELDHRSDQFSLGVVLWELLTGQRLFKADNDALTIQRVTECQVPLPARKGEPLPAALVELVMRALQKDPAHRFTDMAGLGAALEELLTAEQWSATAAELSAFLVALFPEGAEETLEPAPSRASGARPAAEGLALFLERAHIARPGWTPTDEEKASVEAVIAALDGAPLAIELAAARIATIGPAHLVEQLPGYPDRVLHGAIDWTWELLQRHEQLALAQLSVFSGAFTLEAAEAVIQLASFPKAPWALDVLQALRDKALVRTSEVGGELRFELPGIIRAYALQKLKGFGPDTEHQARARIPSAVG